MSQLSSLSKTHLSAKPYQSRHLIKSRMNWDNLLLDTLIALQQLCCTTPFTLTTPDAKSKLYLAELNVTFLAINAKIVLVSKLFQWQDETVKVRNTFVRPIFWSQRRGAGWSPRLQTSGEQCCLIRITTSARYSGIFYHVAFRYLNYTVTVANWASVGSWDLVLRCSFASSGTMHMQWKTNSNAHSFMDAHAYIIWVR